MRKEERKGDMRGERKGKWKSKRRERNKISNKSRKIRILRTSCHLSVYVEYLHI
jgi:hypothetical protein